MVYHLTSTQRLYLKSLWNGTQVAPSPYDPMSLLIKAGFLYVNSSRKVFINKTTVTEALLEPNILFQRVVKIVAHQDTKWHVYMTNTGLPFNLEIVVSGQHTSGQALYVADATYTDIVDGKPFTGQFADGTMLVHT